MLPTSLTSLVPGRGGAVRVRRAGRVRGRGGRGVRAAAVGVSQPAAVYTRHPALRRRVRLHRRLRRERVLRLLRHLFIYFL